MLFNKSSNGASELKSLLGFIYASTSFANLATDIELVTDEMIRLLGKELYNEIEAFYLSEDYDTAPEEAAPEDPPAEGPSALETWKIWRELVHRTQLPIAFYAYRNYASHADLTHSDKGRQIAVSENEKPAFEWMIERDEQSLLMKAHRMTDRLLLYLDEYKTDATLAEIWVNSDAYKASKDNLVSSASVFDSIFPINESRRFYLKILPFIKEVERTKLVPVLSKDTYDALITLIRTPNAEDTNNELLEYARVPVVMYAMGIAARRLSVEILPDGIFQNYISGSLSARAKNPAAMEFKNEVARMLEMQADESIKALEAYIAHKAAIAAGTTYAPRDPFENTSSDNSFFAVP